MFNRRRFYCTVAVVLAGCAARRLPLLTSSHPASPAAAEAPAPSPSTTLTPIGGLSAEETGGRPASMATGHDAQGMIHGMPAVAGPGVAGSFTCPMHPEVRAAKPGRCPKCGMMLVPQTRDQSATDDDHAQ